MLLLVAGIAAIVFVLLYLAYWHWLRPYMGTLEFTKWEIGPVDLSSDKMQELSFIYTPGVRVPDNLFSIEFRGVSAESLEHPIPVCNIVLSIKDDKSTICTLHLKTKSRSWYKPNAGILCIPERYDDVVPIGLLKAGKLYRIEFTVATPIQVPKGAETVLHGSFMWTGTPTQLVTKELHIVQERKGDVTD